MPEERDEPAVIGEETDIQPHQEAAAATLAEISRQLAELAELAKSLVDAPPAQSETLES